MKTRRKRGLWQIGIGLILLLVTGGAYWGKDRDPLVSDFISCAEAGYPIMESYPRQCKTPEGQSFKEDIGNELEKDNLIRIAEPRPNGRISSPLVVKGVARGNWFFEASFPVRLLDAEGRELAVAVAQAKDEWMTTEFVPFEATIIFEKPSVTSGTLVLEKDNPSGLPEHDDELTIPVRFR